MARTRASLCVYLCFASSTVNVNGSETDPGLFNRVIKFLIEDVFDFTKLPYLA